MWGTILISALAVAAAPGLHEADGPARQRAPVRVVTTLPIYAELVREIGGAEVEVSSIANPNEDAHFVRPKPSFALDLRRAEAFVTTGLDLELWVPTLLDRASNTAILEGGRGYITAYTGIQLLRYSRGCRSERWRRPHLRQPTPDDGSPSDVAGRSQHHGGPQAGRTGPGRPLRPRAGEPRRPDPPPALRGSAHRAPRRRDAGAVSAGRQPLRIPRRQRVRWCNVDRPTGVAGSRQQSRFAIGRSSATTRTGRISRSGSKCVARTTSRPNRASPPLRATWPSSSGACEART